MAARSCVLPDIQDLSKEQERARLLPKDGQHLIVGGPGTGKSVLALLRTRRHHRQTGGQDYVFLVYNRLLLEASRELVGGSVKAHPWISWFKALYAGTMGEPCPVVGGRAYALDWEAIGDAIVGAEELPDPETPFVIIDEGQDMPPAFYDALAGLQFENFYTVADQNQQITEEHSSVREIEVALGIEPRQRIELTENYRNCDRVARLALSFCIDDRASPCTKPSPNRRCARMPMLVDYGRDCRWGFETVIERLLKLADRDPSHLIGIITPDSDTRTRWLAALRRQPVQLDNGRPRIVTYAANDQNGDHRFSLGGIFVINAQSAKGLEFDTVILADINGYRCQPGNQAQMDDIRRRFYVMVSRAKEQVYLLRQADKPCLVDGILPTDEDILKRWR